MSVLSLKRPPTLLTMDSSFSSSIILVSFASQDVADLMSGLLYVGIIDLPGVAVLQSQFAASDFQPPLDGGFALGVPLPQASLELFQRAAVDEDGDRIGMGGQNAHGPLHINLQDYPFS